ncbi:MAG: efflux transporter periplasmic adaptor subunit, partial [bacterium]|nr:efflux transporter periplasmic adaptor subunit [bacterium]
MNMLTPIDTDSQGAVLSSPAPRRKRHAAIAAIGLLIAGGVVWKLVDQPQASAAATPIATVGISAPLARTVTQWDDYVGRFAPSQTVEIRPRVSGSVTAIH